MITIDNSQLSTYQSCPMKYYLTYMLGLTKRKVDETNIDKVFGSKCHTCLANYYGKGDTLTDKVWADYIDLPTELESVKTKENGIKLIQEYIKFYDKQDRQQLKVLGVEKILKARISNEIEWLSKVDAVVSQNENIYSLESKTTKSYGYNYFFQFSPNQQITGQVFTIQENYKQCSGVIVNVLEAGFRKRAYKGEMAGFHCEFHRDIVNRNKEQVEDFKENIILWVDRLERSKESNKWGKVESNCHGYRGCSMKEVCLTSKGMVLDEEIVDVLYEKKNPLEYLKEEEVK